MSEQIAYEVSNRREMDGQHGYHVHLQLKRSRETVSYDLLAGITLNDEGELSGVTIETDRVGLRVEDADTLVRAAFRSAWNAVVVGDCAAAGVRWRFLDTWLCGHVGWERGRPICRRIEARLCDLPLV